MKLAATTGREWNTFQKSINHFSVKFFGDEEKGLAFLKILGNYLDTTKFPADKIVADPFTGYSNRFGLHFYYQGNRIGYAQMGFDQSTRLIKVYSVNFEDKSFDVFKPIINEYFDKYNKQVMSAELAKCGVKDLNTAIVNVVFDNYEDYRKDGTQDSVTGTLLEIFDTYTTHNDSLKYINGRYWRFNDNKIGHIYQLFIQTYKGNYFLDNAVKRGVTID